MTEREKYAFDLAVLANAISEDIQGGRTIAGAVVATVAVLSAGQMPTDVEFHAREWDTDDRRQLISDLAKEYVRAQYGVGTWKTLEWWQDVKV